METLPKIDRYEFEVNPTTVDKLHRMRPSALCNMMLSAAGKHADAEGQDQQKGYPFCFFHKLGSSNAIFVKPLYQ